MSNTTLEQVRNFVLEKDLKESKDVQQIWSWGAGTDGQLATENLQDEHQPQILRSLAGIGTISAVSCGGAHVIAITSGGRVVTWGRGTSGQLGHGEMNNCLEPSFVKDLKGFVITHVSAGWNHSGFVADNGSIFTCGDGSFGQLGHGDYKSICSPKKVTYFNNKHVEQVACGMRHSVVLIRGNVENPVYGFGSGKRGQLGISKDKVKSTNLPDVTLGLTNIEIVNINANGDHSAALSASGSFYSWGRGFGRTSDVCIPQHIKTDLSFDQVALGWNHALLLTREGNLFMLGGDRHGVLSEPQKTHMTKHVSGESNECILHRIPDLVETKVLQIAAGAEHSALVTDNGSVMTWGWGEHGQLGLGDTDDRICPRLVNLGYKMDEKRATSSVYCGSGFSFVLRTYSVNL